MGTSSSGRDFRAREKVLQHIYYARVYMCWKLVTSDLAILHPIDKKILLQNVIKTRTKTRNIIACGADENKLVYLVCVSADRFFYDINIYL